MSVLQQGLGVGLVAALATSVGVLLVQANSNNPPAPPTLADAAARLEKRLEALEKLMPGPGEFMRSVQSDFAKLYYAVNYENWELATFEIKEVKEALDQAAIALPEKNGVNLVGLVDAMKSGPLAKIESEVIAKKDGGAFKDLYPDAIQLCNGCHTQTGNGCIRVQVPSAPPVYSQKWEPQPK
ncbi:MAG: hypothetical protein HYR85_06855 [Planctomycetes bacterium]|nr:hypothetical protein [Planctomycetota bacterium]MBI3845225.1 hypothetical protein [Planctomycetota bacterium]